MKPSHPPLDDTFILALTKEGERELREPGTILAPALLEALVLIDGQTNVAQVLLRSRNTAPDVLRTSLEELVGMGLVSARSNSNDNLLDPGDFFTVSNAIAPKPDDRSRAEADANTQFLQRNGYCVNMARRPSVAHDRAGSSKPAVLIIDDDPDICHVLQLYLKLEGFDASAASNREEIVAALRSKPLPDLVLLDVVLGNGLNGFDILAKIRQHPVLKTLPVIMLTAEATREAVLKGILGGADGYITKPFEIHPLVRGVRTVLGLNVDKNAQDWDYSL